MGQLPYCFGSVYRPSLQKNDNNAKKINDLLKRLNFEYIFLLLKKKITCFLKSTSSSCLAYTTNFFFLLTCDPLCQNETLLCTLVKSLSFWCSIKVCILPLIMVVKTSKSDNSKQSYAQLTFGILTSMKWRNRLSMFGVYHCINCQLGQKSSKLHQ